MSRIHLISGPRNISTALMYSFGNRKDMSIVDEPFYAYYLHTHPEIEHPGKPEVLAAQSADIDEIMASVMQADYPTPHVFFKNMAHHMDGMPWDFIADMRNVFLIRDPKQLIASFAQVIETPTLLDIGLELEWEIYKHALSIGAEAVVIDSNAILKNPEGMLKSLCKTLDIPFSTEMLEWPAGARAEDGVWAKYWYKNVHQSTGFSKQKTSDRHFPEHLTPLLLEAQGYYEKLLAEAINIS